MVRSDIPNSKTLYAFDLDGTLVHSNSAGEREVPARLLNAVVALAKRAPIVIATGRRYRAALAMLNVLPPMPYAIVNNGLVIKEREHHQTIHREVMSREIAAQISQIVHSVGVEPFYVMDGYESGLDFLFVESVLKTTEAPLKVFQKFKEHSAEIDNLEALTRWRPDVHIVEVAAVAHYTELLEVQAALSTKLPAPYRCVVVKNVGTGSWGALEIFSSRVSKWSGIEFVKKQLGAQKVVAVGDDENDIEMLSYAEHSVAMAHAQQHVRAAARQEASDADELAVLIEGWAKE